MLETVYIWTQQHKGWNALINICAVLFNLVKTTSEAEITSFIYLFEISFFLHKQYKIRLLWISRILDLYNLMFLLYILSTHKWRQHSLVMHHLHIHVMLFYIIQSLAQLLCEMREANKTLQFENDDWKQKMKDAQGDIKVSLQIILIILVPHVQN